MDQEPEKAIILLLGVDGKPLPTIWHLQKEMFVLSKVYTRIQELFHFRKHYEGPYSQVLGDLIEDPMHYENVYAFAPAGLGLTSQGKRIFLELKTQNRDNKRFEQLLASMKLTRALYDRLSKDELLFLIYATYPEYIELSNIYDKLMGDKNKRSQLAHGLLKKNMITESRYEELIKA
jgi:hypothetical protein